MSMDDHFHQAARGVRDHVAGYPVPGIDPATEPPRSPARYTPTIVFAVVALLLGGLVVVNGGISGDGDGTATGPEAGTDFLEFDLDGDSAGGSTALGGPRDGKESIGLPVAISPAEGLVDGQVVFVTGSGFPASQQVGAVLCAVHGPAGVGAGVDNCQLPALTLATSDAQGNVAMDVAMPRFITVQGQVVDCAGAAPEGMPSACVLAVGAVADYDQSGTAPVWFDPDAPVAPTPGLEVTPTEDLVDGQEVAIRLTNVAPGSEWVVSQCAEDATGYYCAQGTQEPVVADESGTVVTTWAVQRKIDAGYGVGDCAAARCWLEVNGPSAGHVVQLGFAGASLGEVDEAVTETTVVGPGTVTDTTLEPVLP